MSISNELVAALTLGSFETVEPIIQKEIRDRQEQRRQLVGTLYPGILQAEIDSLFDLLEKKQRENANR